MKKIFECRLLDQLPETVSEILKTGCIKNVVAVRGEMGAGKTTLIKEICLQLGVAETVSSPTFSLVNEYQTATNEIIYHFDFYRIRKVEEAFDIGYNEYFESGNLCLVEWPEKIEPLMNFNHLEIFIEEEIGVRKITLSEK